MTSVDARRPSGEKRAVAGDPKTSAEARSEIVLEILRGDIDVDTAAERHGVSREEVERWRDEFIRAGSERLESAPSMRKPQAQPPKRDGKLALVLGLLGVVVIAVVGVVLFKLVIQRGESAEEKACRAGTLTLVRSSKAPLDLVLYTSRGTKTLDRASADLDRLLQRYAKESNGKLRYQLRTVGGPTEREQALHDGLQSFVATDEDAGIAGEAFFGLVVMSGVEKGVIPILSPENLEGIPFWLANKIREVVAKADGLSTPIGVLSGIDELGLDDPNLIAQGATSPNIAGILKQSFPFYAINDVPADSAMDASSASKILFVTQPGRTLSQAELERIDDFVMLGDRA